MHSDKARWEGATQFPLKNLHIPVVSFKKVMFIFRVINPLVTKLVRSIWLDIDLVLFLPLSFSINMQRNSHVDWTSLVSKPCLYTEIPVEVNLLFQWSLCYLYHIIADTSYTMSVKLGDVLSPDTNLYVQLFGEKGETSKIMLRPVGSSLNKFEKGRTYKFTVETVNIGKVSEPWV